MKPAAMLVGVELLFSRLQKRSFVEITLHTAENQMPSERE